MWKAWILVQGPGAPRRIRHGLKVGAMDSVAGVRGSERPTCLGSGLVVLDVIFRAGSDEPEFLAGGSCCNVLTILSYFGWRSFPFARLGGDIEGDRIVEDMRTWGVQDRFIVRERGARSPRIIQRIRAGRNPGHSFSFRCSHGRRLPSPRPLRLDSLGGMEDRIPPARVFYFDRAAPSSLALARRQKKLGSLVVFEPPRILSGTIFKECLEVADVLKYCRGSVREDGGRARPPLEIQTSGKAGLRYRSGMLSQTEWTELPAFGVDGLIDAAGSGDWLTAGLIQELARNGALRGATDRILRDALRFGQCLAALNCLCSGARGLMCRVPPEQVRALASEIISGRDVRQALEGVPAAAGRGAGMSSGCRVCLCR